MSDEPRESRLGSASENSGDRPESGDSISTEKVRPLPPEGILTQETSSTESANVQLTSSQGTTHSSRGFWQRFIWLNDRVEDARSKTFGLGQAGFSQYDAARNLRDGVVQIGETGQSSWAVLFLERDAAVLLAEAHAARRGLTLSGGPLTSEDWEQLRQIPIVQEAWANLSAVQVENLVATTGSGGDAALSALPATQRKTFAVGVHEFVNALAEPLELEASRLGRALFARYTRLAIAGVAVLAVIGMVGSWVSARFEKPNIALHQRVEVSSQYPGAGEDHTLLVDGDRSNLGFHTECQGGWAIVDLGAPRKFDKVVVYNRAEYPERAVPIVLEVSTDHQNFRKLAERKEVFDKWTVSGLGAQGRYVKLRNTSANCFHLAEIEVY